MGFVPDVRFIVTFVSVVTALTLLRFAVGTRLPPVVATPVMLIGVYAWMVLPIAVNDPDWLRHLTGNELGTCCSLDSGIATSALIAPVLMAAGIAGAALTLLSARWPEGWRQASAAAVCLFLGLVGGSAVAQGLPHDPTAPRSPSLLICTEGQPRVCVWPEHAHLLAKASTAAAGVASAWSHYGIAPPIEFTEASPSVAAPGARSFGTWQGADRTELMQAFALSMMPSWPACAEAPSDDPIQSRFLGAEVYDYVLAWFEAAAGVSRSGLAETYAVAGAWGVPDVLTTVDRVQALPAGRQHVWLEHNLAALSSCDVLPRFEP